ncbi:MAG: hypothetical protein QOC63_2043 [Mycobacterium sp.]|jgi:hypothetical protein|nr:hypothetical protein [Mycobacterium sp.]
MAPVGISFPSFAPFVLLVVLDTWSMIFCHYVLLFVVCPE